MAVITISRQYGSGGEEIAQRVCEMLGYHHFDKTMMAAIAADVGLSNKEIVDFSEASYKVRGFLDRLFGSRVVAQVETWREDESGARTRWVENLNEEQCITLVRNTLLAAYQHGNVVILGRGGQALLKEKHGVLHVRVEAPLGARVMRIQRKENLSLGAAETLALQRDQAAAAYLRRFYDINWDNPLLYHMVINTGRWDIEATAQVVAHAVSQLNTVAER